MNDDRETFKPNAEGERLPTLAINYDPWNDVVTIEGITYAAGIFHKFGGLLPVGEWFQLLARESGVITLRREAAALGVLIPEDGE